MVLGAYAGFGKSLLALSIIKSVLTGNRLWGEFEVRKPGTVLLVDEETPKPILKDRCTKMGFHEKLPLHFLHFQGVRLDEKSTFSKLMARIEEINPVLVVIDSFVRVHQQEENDAQSMARLMDSLRTIANRGITVLVVHHHRKAKGHQRHKLRGSSDIPAGVDIEFDLTLEEGYHVLQSVKTRVEPLEPIKLVMKFDSDKIEISSKGTERGRILQEIMKILAQDKEMDVQAIWKKLKRKDLRIGINPLREILNRAEGKELLVRIGPHGIKLYRTNPASQLFTPIDSDEIVKLKALQGKKQTVLMRKRPEKSIHNRSLKITPRRRGPWKSNVRPLRVGQKA